MNEREKFLHEKSENIRKMSADNAVRDLGIEFARATAEYKYSYNFEWMSRPIIQFPQDMIAMQELIWQVKPDLIIETGIAHGGSLVFYASILTPLDGVRQTKSKMFSIFHHKVESFRDRHRYPQT